MLGDMTNTMPPPSDADRPVSDEDLELLLDSVLDDIQPPTAKPLPPKSSNLSSTSPSNLQTAPAPAADADAVFQRELQAGMEQLLRGFGDGDQVKNVVEDLFKDLQSTETDPTFSSPSSSSSQHPLFDMSTLAAALSPPSSTTTAPLISPTDTAPPTSFQSRISETLNRVQTTSTSITQEVSEVLDGDMMATLMTQMESLLGNEDFESTLQTMVDSLVNKDVLLEPMQDLNSKYPAYLEKNKHTLSKEKFETYTKQSQIVTQIVEIFQSQSTTTTSDENMSEQVKSEEDKQNLEIMALMQQMQDLGNPPEEILKEFAPDLRIAPDGTPSLPEMSEKDCKMQ